MRLECASAAAGWRPLRQKLTVNVRRAPARFSVFRCVRVITPSSYLQGKG